MKPSLFSSILIKLSILVTVVALLAACGAPVEESQNEVVPQEDPTMESSSENAQTEMNTSGASFEEQELPANFPEAFPLPDYAKVGSTVDMPGENSFRIFLAFPEVTLEEVLTYYHHELQALGWTVETEADTSLGYKMDITHPEYEAKLDFIKDEYGIVLDLALAPQGELEEIPGSSETLSESEGLGESGGDFPSNFPVPSRLSAIDLPLKLAEGGYQLAFNFPDMAELAIVELSTGLMTGGWEIGDFEFDSMTASYFMPFTGPNGFQGYALITAKPDVAGLDTISGSLIALHPGVMEE